MVMTLNKDNQQAYSFTGCLCIYMNPLYDSTAQAYIVIAFDPYS